MRGSKKGGKRRTAQRERDLAITAERVSMGNTSQTIADFLNARKQVDGTPWPYTLSRRTIDKDIIECKKRWAARSDDAVAVHIGQHEARLNKLLGVYYQGYEKSQENAERTKIVKSLDDEGAPVADGTVEKEVAKQVGDIAFLKGVERMLKEFRDLWALNAPVKIAHTDAKGQRTVEAPPDDSSRTLALVKQLADAGVDVVDDESGEVAE